MNKQKEEIRFETIEDMVAYVLAAPHYDSQYKWTLEERYRRDNSEPVEYYLSRQAGSLHFYHIDISEELAKQLDAVWKHGPRWRGYKYIERKGAVTLQGLLKRLGKTDIAERLNKAKEAAEERRAKIRRNNVRRQIREKSTELYKLVTSDSKIVDWDANITNDVHFFERLNRLMKLIDEE